MTAAVLLAACKKEEPPPAYQAIPIARRDIVVSALASGTVQPDTVVEVKSKASGEILDLRVETGQTVKRGDLMVRVDPRTPSNILAQAKADLDVAEARLANGTSQKRRSDELFESQSITEQEHENALLDYANARAEVVPAVTNPSLPNAVGSFASPSIVVSGRMWSSRSKTVVPLRVLISTGTISSCKRPAS